MVNIDIASSKIKIKKTKSCSCLKKDSAKSRKKDYTGMIFGELTVIEDIGKRGSDGCVYWRCQCSCGNDNYIVISTDLNRTGKRQKLHCNSSIHKVIDLTGQTFGFLTVVGIDKDTVGTSQIKWLCRCSNCDRQDLVSILGSSLKSGKSRTCGCGCNISFGAQKILSILQNEKLDIKTELSFSDLINPETNKKLKFDFGIYKDGSLLYLIEYDGEQHFYYQNNQTSWNTKESFEKTIYRDNLKNDFCIKNNIKLYRIPYYDIHKINILQDILQDKYLVQ